MAMRNHYRVLIVGCGQLGSRHLQAIATLPQVHEVEVVDPLPAALELGRSRLAEVATRNPSTVYRWLSSLEDASHDGDLCIVATQADVRCQLVKQVADSLGYSRFLLEKLVAQSVRDYEDLMRFAVERTLSVWVNCKTRLHPSHKRVKAHLDPAEPITFSVIGGNHGLINNGIHVADLFAFYDGARHIDSAGSRIDPLLHPSKRGNGMFDLSGSLHGYSEKGSRFMLSFAASHDGPMHYTILSPRYRAIVDDRMKWIHESSADSGWSWQAVPFEANLMVSQMTKTFAVDILSSGQCGLPSLEECYPAHRFMLGELLSHFNRLLGRESDRCPAT